jgi:hypothetical protein
VYLHYVVEWLAMKSVVMSTLFGRLDRTESSWWSTLLGMLSWLLHLRWRQLLVILGGAFLSVFLVYNVVIFTSQLAWKVAKTTVNFFIPRYEVHKFQGSRTVMVYDTEKQVYLPSDHPVSVKVLDPNRFGGYVPVILP